MEKVLDGTLHMGASLQLRIRNAGAASMSAVGVSRAKMGEVDVQTSPKPTHAGIEFTPYFTAKLEAGKTPYDEVMWETRTATIGNDKGSVIFEQRDIEVPCDWSQTAANIVASK